MKIYQVNTVCGYGSTGRIAVDIGKSLQEKGHDCRIAYGRMAGNNGYTNSYYIGSNTDHKIHGLLSRITDRQGCYSRNATDKLIMDIIRYAPNIIHLHNIHGYYLNYQRLFNYLSHANIPVVWTFHDCWPFTGHCTYFDMVNCDKWKTMCEKCPQKREYPKSNFCDQSKRNYLEKKRSFTSIDNMHIVCPSEWLNTLVGQSFLSGINHRVINNGIDLTKFHPKKSSFRMKYGIQDKVVLLGVASIWGERKGYSDFLKLANILEDNQVLVMVGLNEKQMKEIPASIIGIRRTNSVDELADVYSAADVFLNLTYQDNFPTANIEALACGTPVITYRTGGSVECIDNDCGAVIERGDYWMVLNILKKQRFSREKCANKAQNYIAKNKYQEYIALYEEIVNNEN